MKRYNCESCHLDFDSDSPQRLTHLEDLALLHVSAEDAEKGVYVCPECIKVPEEDADLGEGL